MNLKLATLRHCDSQAEFEMRAGVSDSPVSWAIRGRQPLKREEVREWSQVDMHQGIATLNIGETKDA
jgi:hypothetical protein